MKEASKRLTQNIGYLVFQIKKDLNKIFKSKRNNMKKKAVRLTSPNRMVLVRVRQIPHVSCLHSFPTQH